MQKILIVGAGIAGCSAAIALARRGVAVRLVEKQPEWRFQSSGIFVYANGLASLRSLGVMAPMVAAGFSIAQGRNVYLDHHGAPIVDVFYPGDAADPTVPPILGIKRAEMHRVLAAQLDSLRIRVELGVTVASLAQLADGVSVGFADGSSAQFDLVIGADGIRSQLREMLWPDVTPRYTGFGVWRSVHARPPALKEKIMLMGVGKRLGIMPISHDRLYLFGTVPQPAGHHHERSRWPALMREAFSEFQGPAREFLDELTQPDSAAEVLYTAVEEVAMPLPWQAGRVLLIGDAAHASTPFMGQGGAMAVQDAVVLGELFDQGLPMPAMLAKFGERRHPVCRFVQDASRQVGEAGATEDLPATLKRNAAMRAGAQAQVDGFYAELARLSALD